ncbi:MAG: M14 family zinc carboxypeptidase [Verrucomicrobia bacterium]|nr:M14 family zinc carboxypeptidase [Verrucomicrobiota bacterium]
MNDLSVITNEFGNLDAYTESPVFWPVDPLKAGPACIETFEQATRRVIGRSVGGRDILALEYGEKEATGATTDCLASAMSASIGDPDATAIYPQAFYGDRRRKRPSLCIQSAIHGGELTGTAAVLNLCSVIESGCDLRGRPWPRLAALARATRLTMIPWLNIDAAVRWPLPNNADAPNALQQRCTQGVAKDGTCYRYPQAKSVFPIPPADMAFMGAYYNDNGVNLQYDFCMPRRQPETTAWMDYYLDERPDAVLILHTNAGTLFGPPEAMLPEGFQHEISRIAGAVRQRFVRDNIPIGRLSWAGLPGFGKPAINQINAVYHVCGALPLLCELPAGSRETPYSLDAMLDAGLTTFEEVLLYGHDDGFRPYEWRKKIL